MTKKHTHTLAELGLQWSDIKGKIGSILKQEETVHDPEKLAALRKERQSLQIKEAGMIKLMKELQADRHD